MFNLSFVFVMFAISAFSLVGITPQPFSVVPAALCGWFVGMALVFAIAGMLKVSADCRTWRDYVSRDDEVHYPCHPDASGQYQIISIVDDPTIACRLAGEWDAHFNTPERIDDEYSPYVLMVIEIERVDTDDSYLYAVTARLEHDDTIRQSDIDWAYSLLSD